MADQELRKAFVELQMKMTETNQRVNFAQVQIENLKRSNIRIDLTQKEISELPPETKTYESIGRMFMLEPISTVCKNLMSKKQANEEKIKNHESNISRWTDSVKQSEENLREMIALHREK
ncbi:prefoldin subunit 1-like [Dysidea avara]|uniref:prefoldin subunit 1-like n=1 Tax=Dysidea avara TaxID=196820 RepID=UPI0033288698